METINEKWLDGLDAVGGGLLAIVLIAAAVVAFVAILGRINLDAIGKRHQTEEEWLAELNATKVSDKQIRRIIAEEKRRQESWTTKSR